ncbi:MAG TPA: formate/nitrite transporter family protein [Mogibacterium sp.]|nr:formate/nitrite transporter family protein [Mogibacterium sp.]
MYREEIETISKTSLAKLDLLENNPKGYILSAMLAGLYVGIGVMFAFTAGGYLSAAGSPATKIMMGIAFGVALSLVIIAGAELFTGNNLVLAIGSLNGALPWHKTLLAFLVCFLGNWLGSILAGGAFYLTGLATGPVSEFMVSSAAIKMSLPPLQLFMRAALCNVLVCLAVWCGYRSKSESGKLIMIFWCLFAFITTGFEHSIANMTLFTIALFVPHGADVSIAGCLYNIIVAAIGNVAGAIIVLAIPYFIISGGARKKQ